MLLNLGEIYKISISHYINWNKRIPFKKKLNNFLDLLKNIVFASSEETSFQSLNLSLHAFQLCIYWDTL